MRPSGLRIHRQAPGDVHDAGDVAPAWIYSSAGAVVPPAHLAGVLMSTRIVPLLTSPCITLLRTSHRYALLESQRTLSYTAPWGAGPLPAGGPFSLAQYVLAAVGLEQPEGVDGEPFVEAAVEDHGALRGDSLSDISFLKPSESMKSLLTRCLSSLQMINTAFDTCHTSYAVAGS
jgi:hypothetical protein